jgi:creatinine amidohydrolase/Fe(II)-dependent formamide hydrolase-like protein
MMPRLAARCCAFVFLLATTAAALAAMPDTVLLEQLTWTELRDAIAAGSTTVIMPIGGVEQSGPAMALGKHDARVQLLSERIARALGNALVAPVLAYVPEGNIDPPTAHMRFPGTITVPEPVFEQLVESAARSFRHAGFRDIVLLGDHGGYQKGLQAVATRLNRAWAASGVRVHALPEYYRAAESEFAALLKQRGFRDEEIGTHAGLLDTSLTLALAPALVRSDQLAARMGRADGVYGDPRRASADIGRIGADLVVRRTVEAIRRAIARR